jgi:hypothetical protein
MELRVSIVDNLLIGSIFTAVSLLRSFTLRRLFEAIRTKGCRTASKSHGQPSAPPR